MQSITKCPLFRIIPIYQKKEEKEPNTFLRFNKFQFSLSLPPGKKKKTVNYILLHTPHRLRNP